MRKGAVICFIGIDGSGKTTLAKEVAAALKEKGVRCAYTYGRYVPMLSRPFVYLGQKIFLKNRKVREYEDYSGAKKDAVKKYRMLAAVYREIILLDYSLQLLIRLIIPKMTGRTIVCDRYVYDTVINDIPRQSDKLPSIKAQIDRCFTIAPKPDRTYLIEIDLETAYGRKADTPSMSYLRERRELYHTLRDEYGFILLDGKKTIDELREQVLSEEMK